MERPTLLELVRANPENFDAFLIDLDGTVRLGNQLIPGAAEFINFLRERKIPFRFLTNSGAQLYDGIALGLTKHGITAYPGDVVSCLAPVGDFFRAQNKTGKAWKFFLVGKTLEPEIPGVITYETDPAKIMECDGVQLNGGSHPWEVTLTAMVNFFIRYPERLFLVPNPDILNPLPNGVSICANGLANAVCNLLKTAGIEKKQINFGKPNPAIYQAALKSLNMSASKKIVGVGDLLTSDIEGANRAGLSSAVVLSGLTTEETLKDSGIQPHYVCSRLS